MKKTKDLKNSLNKERFQSFIPLANLLSDDFKILSEKLLFLIREHGISRIEPNIENKEELLEFAKYVHQGWKEAQSLIVDRVLKNLALIDELQAELKESHRSRDKTKTKEVRYALNSLKVENKVMRRMIDAIAWAMLKSEHSTVRRLSTKGGHTNFSAHNIKDALSTLEQYNQNDHQIAICCDLTTFIHVGDILVFDYETGETCFVELKSGNKNMALSNLAAFAVESECKFFEQELKEKLLEKDIKHFERLKKQAWVGKTVMDTINHEKGMDHNTGKGVRIYPTTHEPKSYGSRILKCYEQLNVEKTWAIDTIDECLHIGVYNKNDDAFVGFNGWMDIIKCKSPIYNITDSFRIPTSTPFASLNLPTELLKKVIAGEITIILCLDIRAFVDVANSMFPNFLTYADKKRTAQADQENTESLKLEGQAIVGTDDGIVGQGLADRMLFDLRSPKQVIKSLRQALTSEPLS